MSRGRHRKPTHTGRNLAVISASGAFALPAGVLAAPAAQAAPTGILDVIEQCESGGRNIPNSTGSSASGFWQITDGTLASLGGSGSAMDLSRGEQRRMAEKLLATRGTQPWNASKHCWGGKGGAVPQGKAQRQAPKASSRTAPKATPRRAPAPNAAGLGQRASDGTGRYVCAPDKLFFEACDPGTLGQVVAYPLYDGYRASRAPAAPVSGRSVAALAQPAAPSSAVASGARQYLGVPYQWGGENKAGMDCSGLVYRVLLDRGIAAPRTSAGQHAWTKRISASQARPGDLVFFYSPVSHVGIVTRPGWMIDSSQPGTRITERRIYPNAKYGRIPG